MISEDVYFRKMGEEKSQNRSDVSLLMFCWNQGRVISADQGDVWEKKQHGQERKEIRPFLVKQKNRGAFYKHGKSENKREK